MKNISELLLNKLVKSMMHRSMKVHALSSPPVLKAPTEPLLLYVHIPFCEVLCPYCSFFKVKFDEKQAIPYFDALEKEILCYSERGFKFDEVYVGGGTPTVMPERLGGVLQLIRSLWDIREISVETNPNHLQPRIMKTLKDSGVTRLSVGVQTFDDELLRKLKRFNKYGSGDIIQERLRDAAGIFETLNVDMIFNFPEQSEEMLERDIAIIKNMNLDQATFYPLMSSTSVKEKIKLALGHSNVNNEKKFYKLIVAALSDIYERTSSWCFTRKGNTLDEYITNRDSYIGVGSGAFFYLSGNLFTTTFSIEHYIEMINADIPAITMGKQLSGKEKLQYFLLMAFFSGKLPLKTIRKNYGRLWFIHMFFELSLAFLLRAAIFKEGSLKATERGRFLSVTLMRDFFTTVNNIREQCRRLSDRRDKAA
ncbi:MAG: coproporphyrinogen III oxidase family protein [Spirochaetia bacterium]|jgi:coproporphyrinogen III oxidase-like Fe-S oxidoreductase|nr:coproporphyrinogen III oxidase family protein [Spirochaetia bacterium]